MAIYLVTVINLMITLYFTTYNNDDESRLFKESVLKTVMTFFMDENVILEKLD